MTEEVFNTALGNAIKRAMPAWRNHTLIEKTKTLQESPALHADVFVVHDSIPPVAIESSIDEGDADRDAIERLGKHYVGNGREIQTAIAVPLTEDEIDMSHLPARHVLRYAMHQPNRRFPKNGYMRGNVHDLIRFVATTAVTKERMEEAADLVAKNVLAAAGILEPAIRRRDLMQISKTLYQRSALTGLRTTMVLWLNAFLVQQRLYGGSLDIPRMTSAPGECSKAWMEIYRTNWKAIFKPAIDILDRTRAIAMAEVSEALGLLIDAVECIETARLGTDINIGAELFPKIAEDRKESAAFYTQPATAELLAALTITRDMTNWSKPEIFKRFRLADITCGTGTLLRFGYRQVKAHHMATATRLTDDGMGMIHRDAMEHGLIGTDVSPIASHLTSTSLAVDTREPYGDTNIGWVGVGDRDRTGAIEYIARSSVQDLLMTMVGVSSGQGDGTGYNSVVIKHGSVDAILMNPPYSRTRRGQSAFDIAGLSDRERAACQKKWGKLIKGQPCIKTAGMAATFLCIARKKVKPGGRIGFVLPKALAFDRSWKRTRDMVELDFTDITAVSVSTGRARGKTGLSADTHLEEMLLVATRKEHDDGKRSPVRCVTLNEPATRLGEAAETARAIIGAPDDGPVMLGDEIGISIMFETNGGAPWSSVGVTHDSIDFIVNQLVSGRVVDINGEHVRDVPMTTIAELFEVGPTHDLIGHLEGGDPRGAFTFYKMAGAGDAASRYRSLWKTDAKTQTSLIVQPTHKGARYRKDRTGAMWAARGTLFLQRGIQWTSQGLLAATTERPAMGSSAWTGLLHDDAAIRKAFAIWANSIYGFATYWSQGNRSQLGRTRLQVKGIHDMPCPDLGRIKRAALEKAATAFDRLCKQELLPAWEADHDPVRAKVNKAASRLLGISNYDAATLTGLWCAESSVRHNKRV